MMPVQQALIERIQVYLLDLTSVASRKPVKIVLVYFQLFALCLFKLSGLGVILVLGLATDIPQEEIAYA